jgi:hypothetical protein
MALATPTGQQDGVDATWLPDHRHWWRPWEQNGASISAGFKDLSNDPVGHYTWRVQRSADNVGKP